MFYIFFIILMVVVGIFTLVLNAAYGVVSGIIGFLIYFVLCEINRCKTSQGQKEIKKQYKKEKKIEEYWGTIEYLNKK